MLLFVPRLISFIFDHTQPIEKFLIENHEHHGINAFQVCHLNADDGTTLLGNLVITLDPVFSGLAIAIIFGILTSTVFTLFVVPVVYYLVYMTPEQN